VPVRDRVVLASARAGGEVEFVLRAQLGGANEVHRAVAMAFAELADRASGRAEGRVPAGARAAQGRELE
jgi:hypothetical protein